MADEPTEHTDEQSTPAEPTPEAPVAGEAPAVPEENPAQPLAGEEPAAEGSSGEETAGEETVGEETVGEGSVGEETVAVAELVAQPPEQSPVEEVPAASEPAVEPVADQARAAESEEDEEDEAPAPRVKPSVPGAHLEVDIVPEGVDPLAPEQPADPYAIEEDEEPQAEVEDIEGERLTEPISTAAIDLASGARYKATGKRKTAIARVILKPGSGAYLVNGRALDEHFPRVTLQRNIRQPLETVGYQDRMDVIARLHGGGISAQAGALRHGISRALLEADPNLRGELKRRGFLTRDSRAKERKKAGLKKARKRPQFSKR
jgi:small subunit ribosomal protein S9